MINKFSKSIYEKIIDATKLFGKLNLQLATLENPYILTYVLEAIDAISSNEIENIHTTLNEAYTNEIKKQQDPFSLYKQTLKIAHKKLMNKGIIQTADLEFINNSLRNVKEGIRKTPVSIKKNNKIIHKGIDVQNLNFELKKLIDSINIFYEGENEIIKALDIHHTFEWIHPFNDGNGRTGRILFALILYKYKVLNIPCSVFSYSIMKNKQIYYRALKQADEGNKKYYYEKMLEILIDSLKISLLFIKKIKEEIQKQTKNETKNRKKIIKFLFSGVKTNNSYLCKKTNLNNKTVSKYIDQLINEGLIVKERHDKYVAYKNIVLEKIIIKFFNKVNF